MASPALERKVRQLDNDVHPIYELLTGISITQVRHGNRLEEFDQRFDALEARFASMEARFASMDSKVDSILALLQARDGG